MQRGDVVECIEPVRGNLRKGQRYVVADVWRDHPLGIDFVVIFTSRPPLVWRASRFRLVDTNVIPFPHLHCNPRSKHGTKTSSKSA